MLNHKENSFTSCVIRTIFSIYTILTNSNIALRKNMLSFSLFKLDNNISVYKSYDLIAYGFWFKLFNGFAVEVDYINQLFVGYAKT